MVRESIIDLFSAFSLSLLLSDRTPVSLSGKRLPNPGSSASEEPFIDATALNLDWNSVNFPGWKTDILTNLSLVLLVLSHLPLNFVLFWEVEFSLFFYEAHLMILFFLWTLQDCLE